jgi:hypothetical protein
MQNAEKKYKKVFDGMEKQCERALVPDHMET